MRATLRITWLLLSLSFLFDRVSSDDGNLTDPPVMKDNDETVVTATTAPSVETTAKIAVTLNSETKTDKPVRDTTAAPTTAGANKNDNPTQKPTDPTGQQTTAAVTNPATTAVAKTDAIQPKTTVVITNPPVPTVTTGASPPVVNSVTLPAATTRLPKIINLSVTTDSSGGVAPSTRVTTVQTPQAVSPKETSEALAGLPDLGTVGTTMTTKIPTDAPTTKQESRTNLPITPPVSQGDRKGVIVEATKTSQAPTPSRTTQPTENLETTGTPSDQIKPVVTTTSKAGTTPSQTTVIFTTVIATAALPKKFVYSLLSEQEEEKDLAEVCKRLMPNWQNGTCTLTWRNHNGKVQFDLVEINGEVETSQAEQFYEEITKKPTDNKTLIAILASCGALLIMIVILAVCASHHRKPYNENQQHLTEEMHTVENGYHDNPTLEVMEVQPEMQEKKVALNGEFNDSWIVPIDNLLKEDVPDEEDTHL